MSYIYKDGVYYNRSGGDGAQLPSGGTTGQALVKHSNTDQDVEWGDVDGLPSGGTAGQALIKQSSTDGDADWEDIDALPSGGTQGQVLTKQSSTDGDASWDDIAALPLGGTTGQFLKKKSNSDGDAEWASVDELPSGGTTGQVLKKKSNSDGDAEWENENSYSGGDGININSSNVISTVNMAAADMAEIIDPLPQVMARRTNYSLEEQLVGYWIDGKPIYQKTIEFGELPNNTTKSLNHGISNLKRVIRIDGYAYNSSTGRCRPIQYVGSDANNTGGTRASVTPSAVEIGCVGTGSTYTECYCTIQYTKTTD